MNSTKNASGAAGRRIYLDSIEEAFARATPASAPKQPRRQIQDCSVRQLKNVEKERRLVGKWLAKADGLEPEQLAMVIESSAKVTDQMVKLSQSIRLGAKDEREAMAGLSEAQLDELFIAQLVRNAAKVNDDQRRTLIAVWFGQDVADVLCKPQREAEAA